MRKKILGFLILLISITSFSQESTNTIDSLKSLLLKSNGEKWIDVANELSFECSYEDYEYANILSDDAIEFSKNLKYDLGLGNAFQVKGRLSYIDNKTITGVAYFEKAAEIFTKLNLHSEIAASIEGIARGYVIMNRNIEAADTLLYTINIYGDSIKPDIKTSLYNLLSKAYRAEGVNDLAVQAIENSIIIEKEHNLLHELTYSYNSLGVLFSETGQFKKSIYYYDLMEDVARINNDSLSVAYSLHNKAIIYLDWGIFDESLNLFLQSKEIVQNLNDEKEVVGSLSSIAVVYHEIGDLKTAKEYYYSSIKLAEKYNDDETKFISLHNLGEVMIDEKKYDSALFFLNKGLRYEMGINNPIGIAQSKSVIASVYITLEKFNMAFAYFKESENTFLKYDDKQGLASLYIEMAKAHQKLQNDSLSIEFYEKGLSIANAINDRKLMLDSYMEASKNYERLRLYKDALNYYKIYKALNDSMFNENSSSRLDYMTLKLENQERDEELAKLESEKKLTKLENKNRLYFLLTFILILAITVVFFSWRYNLKRKSEINLTKQYNTVLETEQKIKALLDASFDSTLLVDTYGKIVTANNNNLNGFLEEADAIIGKEISSFFSETNNKVLHRFFELVLITKLPKDIHLQERNNTRLNIKISPVVDHNNTVTSLAFYIKDITQIEKDKEEKVKMQGQLIQTQKMETVGTLAGGIAHDFNNFLATISGYVSMSLEDIEKENHVYGYLEKTKKAVGLAQGTVKKLLAFSRSSDVVFDKVSLKQLLKDSIDMLKGSKPKNIKLSPPSLKKDYELLADINQLTQVIINITTNAFHAIDDDKGIIEFKVSETMTHQDFLKKKMICIEIKDNGMGIDKESIERIFEPFYTTKEVGKGTGLGLSVVSGIIKQHKGKIEVDSEFGVGSTFYIYLPIIS